MSLIWLSSMVSCVIFTKSSIPERSAIPRLAAFSVVSSASSAGVMASPTGLPSASLMAVSRFRSANVTLIDVGVGVGMGVGEAVGMAIRVGVGDWVVVGVGAGSVVGVGVDVGSADLHAVTASRKAMITNISLPML